MRVRSCACVVLEVATSARGTGSAHRKALTESGPVGATRNVTVPGRRTRSDSQDRMKVGIANPGRWDGSWARHLQSARRGDRLRSGNELTRG